MSEFNLGDRLRVTNIATDTGVDVDVISVEEDLSDGERGLRLATPEGYNVYKYESVLADEELRVELVKPAAERLPTEPGQYIEVNQTDLHTPYLGFWNSRSTSAHLPRNFQRPC